MGSQASAIRLGRLAGLEVSALPSAVVAFLLLWVVLGVVGIWVLGLSAGEAIIGGLLGALLHDVAEVLHQLGHAWAARRTGYPMTGIRFWWLLSASLYPENEPQLPREVHVRRALGGPIASAVWSVLSGVIVLALAASSVGGVAWWLALFFFLDNLLVFTLGSLLPLGFTDGSTLLEHR
ncbi:MAG: hypothetical protein ACJ78Q_07610 [Chloroflexia bacterium]